MTMNTKFTTRINDHGTHPFIHVYRKREERKDSFFGCSFSQCAITPCDANPNPLFFDVMLLILFGKCKYCSSALFDSRTTVRRKSTLCCCIMQIRYHNLFKSSCNCGVNYGCLSPFPTRGT